MGIPKDYLNTIMPYFILVCDNLEGEKIYTANHRNWSKKFRKINLTFYSLFVGIWYVAAVMIFFTTDMNILATLLFIFIGTVFLILFVSAIRARYTVIITDENIELIDDKKVHFKASFNEIEKVVEIEVKGIKMKDRDMITLISPNSKPISFGTGLSRSDFNEIREKIANSVSSEIWLKVDNWDAWLYEESQWK